MAAREAWRRRIARGMPWVSLAGGALTTWLWRAGIDLVRAAIVLASLVGIAALLALFPPWRPEAQRRLDALAWWGSVKLAQNVLWFVTPFYVASTTWTSRNALFTALLIALLVLWCFDALLQRHLLRGARIAAVFVFATGLAAYQLILPVLSGVAPRHAIWASGALAAWSVAPLWLRGATTRSRGVARALVAGAACALAARLALSFVPPAPMRLASVIFAGDRDGLEPRDALSELRVDGPPAFVFVSVDAPRGLRESVRLRVAGAREVMSRPLEIIGGRAGGYRLWEPLPPLTSGRALAEVATEGGQIVGVARIPVR